MSNGKRQNATNRWWIPVLASVLAAFVGNITTVCGPPLLSWGTLPRFVKDPVYKKLEGEGFKLNNRLDKILLDTDSFYKQRTYELTFSAIRKGKLVQQKKVTTLIFNPFSRISEVDVSMRLAPETVLKYLIVKDENGEHKLSHQGEDASAVRNTTEPRTISLRPFNVESGKTYTMETDIESEVPLSSKEAFVTKKTILGFYEMKIKIDKTIMNKLKFSTESLSYEPLPVKATGSECIVYRLAGPIFPGGGLLIEWNYQDI